MNRAQETALYGRFAVNLGSFLKRRMSAAEAQAIVCSRLQAREANLAATLRQAVFGHPGSPYLPLLRWAGCELEDIERMLGADGVEATLETLFDAGVRVSFEEWKGRRPIIRGGRTLAVAARHFDNPLVRSGVASGSSGTGGPPSKTYHDLGHILETIPFRLLSAEAHGMRGAPMALWFSPPPSIAGVNSTLAGVVMGYPPERWWAPADADIAAPLAFHRFAGRMFFALARLHGARLAAPEPLSLEAPDAIVRWAREALDRAGRCEIRAFASTGMRIARAACRHGVDLSGARLLCGGEAASPAKQRLIESCGARMISYYGSAECGPIGISCPLAADVRDLHLSSDRLALIERPVPLPGWSSTVSGLFVTALLPGAPKVMLNVETDDCGALEGGGCGCPLESWGLGVRLQDVRSYRRHTAADVTLVPERGRRAIEELLPAAFGGSALDYQLHEERAAASTRWTLRVDPRVPFTDEAQLTAFAIGALADCDGEGADGCWRHGGPLRILRQRPLVTAGGKQLPIVVAPTGESTGG